jgi:hypothetical protein
MMRLAYTRDAGRRVPGATVIQPECREGSKQWFQRRHSEFLAKWTLDEYGVVNMPLEYGKVGRFSARHRDLVSQFMWHILINKKKNVTKYYVQAQITGPLVEKYGECLLLHRFILGVDKNTQVDHIDGNGLNCVDSNMRLATRSENASNRLYVNSTGYRGVIQRGKRYKTHKFIAQIEHEGKHRHLGTFDCSLDAARAYNEEAYRLFGEFAILNQIPGWEPESKTVPGGNGMIGDLP